MAIGQIAGGINTWGTNDKGLFGDKYQEQFQVRKLPEGFMPGKHMQWTFTRRTIARRTNDGGTNDKRFILRLM